RSCSGWVAASAESSSSSTCGVQGYGVSRRVRSEAISPSWVSTIAFSPDPPMSIANVRGPSMGASSSCSAPRGAGLSQQRPIVARVPWSVEDVRALAPDPTSAAAGRAQAQADRWTGLGASDAAVWGACRGRGEAEYLTCVEPAGPAFRCSCPSRKGPCKHALGLAFLWADGAVPAGEEPQWVAAWRAGRGERRRGRPPGPPRDPEAAARRAERRGERVAAGAAELREWLADRVRGGLAGAAADEVHGVAARMVDAQAPGLASGLRRAAALIGQGRDWPGLLLTELALLHVLAEAATRLPELPDDLAATVRARLGFPVDTAEVLATGERVTDEWLVAAVTDEVGERLTTRRTWLRGRT